MLTLAQASDVASRQLQSLWHESSDGVEVQLLSERTEEFDVGWLFFYQSACYLKTGNINDSLVGNTPLFVSRTDGRSFFVTYHRPIAESLAAYRACGNPNAQEISAVRLIGWNSGAQAIAAIQAVRQYSAVGLGEAKAIVDGCLANHPGTISVESVANARTLVAALAVAGFRGEVCYDC